MLDMLQKRKDHKQSYRPDLFMERYIKSEEEYKRENFLKLSQNAIDKAQVRRRERFLRRLSLRQEFVEWLRCSKKTHKMVREENGGADHEGHKAALIGMEGALHGVDNDLPMEVYLVSEHDQFT